MSVLYQSQAYRVVSSPLVTTFDRSEDGTSLIECALILPIFIFLLVGAVDLGRAWYLHLEVSAAAEAGALYGVQNTSDIPGMDAAALIDAGDVTTLQAAATYGTECFDGTSVTPLLASPPSCSVNAIAYVEVDTTATYTPILKYPGLASVFTLVGKSRMRAAR